MNAEMSPGGNTDGLAARLMARNTDGLAGHLADRYDIEVTGLDELDLGVFRVEKSDGQPWVARVFPAIRPLAQAHGDAELLRRLKQGGFPAERCAHPEPVSVLADQGVLVTEFVPGSPPDRKPRTVAILGALLGRLHARPGEGVRPGGAWHHLAVAGGPAEEIEAALTLLNSSGAPHRLSEEVRELDDCADLPHSLVHPDFVPPNAIQTAEGGLVIVDWTGAGRGPRLWSLGFLLFVAGARSLKLVDVVVSRYRRHTQLQPAELERLADAILARPLLMDCWSVAMGRKDADQVSAQCADLRRLAERIAAQARRAFAAPPE